MAAATYPLPAVAAACFLVLLGHLPPPAAAELVVVGNSRLFAGQALYNRYRDQRLIMQRDCNLVVYHSNTPRWASNTGGLATSCEAVLVDPAGYLVVSNSNTKIWSSTRTYNPLNYVLVLQNDLNVVIYSRPVWSAETPIEDSGEYQIGDQVLVEGSTLEAGQYLENENMHFQLIMQNDCALALYDDGALIWSTETSGKGYGCSATMREDGRLVIEDIHGDTVWVSSKHAPNSNHVLVLEPDGDVSVYTGAVWESGSGFPKGAEQPISNSTEVKAAAAAAASAHGAVREGDIRRISGRKTMIHIVTNEA